MQIQIPYLEPLEDVTEVLALVSNSKKYTERVKVLDAVTNKINELLKTVEDLGKLNELRSQAASQLATARGVKTDADKYAEKVKGDADQNAKVILAAAQNQADELAVRATALAKREEDVALRGVEQDAKEKDLVAREKQAVADLERAAAVARQGQALQDRLTAKLGQLHSIAVE